MNRTLRGMIGGWLLLPAMMLFGGAAPSGGAERNSNVSDGDESDSEVSDGDVSDGEVARGYRLLTEVPLLPSDFSEDVFDAVWQSWPEPLRSKAASATPAERRAMAFDRYGLTRRPDETSDDPLQYVVADGQWTMNCFSCHGGSVYGTPVPGAPNNRFALQTLTEEIRATKFREGVPLGRMDLGAFVIPLGTTVGTTNAVVFGLGLMHFRDADLNVLDKVPGRFLHHDMDTPPWWHYSKRPYLYIDGFAEKGHRGLMQFMLVPENGPEFFREREADFRDVHAYLNSLEPPRYPGAVDADLASEGRHLFENHCSECHGRYGDEASYPNRHVAIDDVGTDPVRFQAITVEAREHYAKSWFGQTEDAGPLATVVDPVGYVAPPLHGVWASPPYLHNGSVPTLWHVLHPDQRPRVWRRSAEAIDHERIGFQIEIVDRVPMGEPDIAVRREYFDSARPGKSNAGHDYPDALTDSEKLAVLEYLKTL